MGELHYFVGVKILRDDTTGAIWIGQPAYAEGVSKKFGTEHAKVVTTPIDPSS